MSTSRRVTATDRRTWKPRAASTIEKARKQIRARLTRDCLGADGNMRTNPALECRLAQVVEDALAYALGQPINLYDVIEIMADIIRQETQS